MVKIQVVGACGSPLSARLQDQIKILKQLGCEVVLSVEGAGVVGNVYSFVILDELRDYPAMANPKDYRKSLPEYQCIGRSGKQKKRGW